MQGSKDKSTEIVLDPWVPDMEITYRDRKGATTTRQIRPLSFRVFETSTPAIGAHCHLRDEFRNFYFDQIVSAHIKGQSGPSLSSMELRRHFAVEIDRLNHFRTFFDATGTNPSSWEMLSDLETFSTLVEDTSQRDFDFDGFRNAVCEAIGGLNEELVRGFAGFNMTWMAGAVMMTGSLAAPEEISIDFPTRYNAVLGTGSAHERLGFLAFRQEIGARFSPVLKALAAHRTIAADETVRISLAVDLMPDDWGKIRFFFRIGSKTCGLEYAYLIEDRTLQDMAAVA